MRVDQLVLSVIGASGAAGIAGRTRLQKVIYFVCRHLHIDARYSPYYYGPYSEQVARSVESLVARGLVSEDVSVLGSEGPFEGRLYSYALTPEGRDYLNVVRDEHPDEARSVQRFCRSLLEPSPSTKALAVASKLHIIVGQSSKPVRETDLTTRARNFGWQIEEGDVAEAKRFLRQHGLIRLTPAH